MTAPSAKVVLHSVADNSPPLVAMLAHYPKFVHAEHTRHRAMSLCVSSSRAIPVKRNLEIVRSDELRAEPVFWGAEQKGMSPGEELSDDGVPEGVIFSPRKRARDAWTIAAHNAAQVAEHMVDLGVHKSIINRLLDPFLPVNVLVTSCEPGLMNFFGLRLDKAADPTIRALAEAMWAVYNESTPQKLEPGQWHLPFIDWTDVDPGEQSRQLIKVSVARCARLSYMSHDTGKRSTIEEDLKLYDKLVGAQPIHASPAEHQATPDSAKSFADGRWENPHLHGNLSGWIQYRKTLPGEAVAPLPEGHSLG